MSIQEKQEKIKECLLLINNKFRHENLKLIFKNSGANNYNILMVKDKNIVHTSVFYTYKDTINALELIVNLIKESEED